MRSRKAIEYRSLTFQQFEERLPLSLPNSEALASGIVAKPENEALHRSDDGHREDSLHGIQPAEFPDETSSAIDRSRGRLASKRRVVPEASRRDSNGKQSLNGQALSAKSADKISQAVDTLFGQTNGSSASAASLTESLQLRDVEYRSTKNDFHYSSKTVDATVLRKLVTSSRSWARDPAPARSARITETDLFLKTTNYFPPQFSPDGLIVARRVASYDNSHTMLIAQKKQSDHFLQSGTYLRQDHHYHISFDVRHPASELSWLRDHDWAIVHQLWGPRESRESARNPPLAIYTSSEDGNPVWVVRSYGDARRTTQTGEFEETYSAQVPYENLHRWQHWDVEYVANPFGKGMVRAWLNGQLVAEWLGIKSNYYSIIDGWKSGPLNPGFGLYSPLEEDGMEAHFDNITIQSNGLYKASLAGRVSGSDDLANNIVVATDLTTGKQFGVRTGRSGIYTLALPKGTYSVTAINARTNQQVVVPRVAATGQSQVVDLVLPGAALSQRGARGRLGSGR